MELIPAIDVLNNIVVKAFLGKRKKYKPIKSKLINSSNLEKIIYRLLKEYKFKVIYIADLNAIMGKKNNFIIIKKVIKKFPNIEFWVDCGVRTFLDIKQYENLPLKIIIGSETLRNTKELKKINKYKRNEIILSLDFKDNNLLGPLNLLKNQKLWPKKVIFMLIDSIGTKKISDLKKLKKFFLTKKKDFYLAGGVSNNKDINFLKKNGFKGTVLSTAIHEKKINYKNL
ncbi:MAG: hypothetical protein CFH26_00207 [Alphaproteobacteria bacterium MarineAlpha6_Bin4]|nr:MAG: hypothetical protein CFH25_00155 [Alphaproteobacteria bacterium MarineAlpha6_Bin3]PPR38210.1 MAG: hypothetical protein CFH26_00207 [Alphaproteobacteria bacterium MarineAlpha6_Bin4]|tara:strand:+ start:1915 stop:2598 length:684 start_codon:yes stop_codon:yes gene_type:complete